MRHAHAGQVRPWHAPQEAPVHERPILGPSDLNIEVDKHRPMLYQN
jgi:hypothetical protein